MLNPVIFSLFIHAITCSSGISGETEIGGTTPSATSLKALDSMWRLGGIYDFEPSMLENEEDFKEYLKGIVSICVFGVVPAALLLLFAFPWCLCRTCRCLKCCQGQAKKDEDWTIVQRWSGYAFVILCFLAFIIFAALGYQANGKLSDAFWAENEGMYDILRNELMGDLITFSDVIHGDLTVIYDAAVENGTIQQNVDSLELWRSDIENGNDDIIAQLETYCSNTNDKHFVDGTTYYVTWVYNIDQNGVCDAWVEEVEAYADGAIINGQFEEGVWPTFDSTLNEVVNTMGDVREDIWDAVGSVMDDVVVPARDSADEFKVSLDDSHEDALGFEDTRNQAYSAIFALPMLPLIVLIFAWCFKKPWMFTISYALSWFIAILLFVILGLHLPIAGFAQDFCQFLDTTETDGFENALNVSASLADMGKLADACLENSKLVTVFGLDSQLNFTSEVEFPSVNVDQFFEFETWNTYLDEEPNTYVSAYTPPLPNPHNTVEATSKFNYVIDQSNLVDDQIESTRILAQAIADDMTNVEHTFTPVFDAANNIVNRTRCGFIGNAYVKFKKNTCEDALSSLSLMCACIGVNAIFCVILTITIIRCRKRFKQAEDTFEFDGKVIEMGREDMNKYNGERPEVGAPASSILL